MPNCDVCGAKLPPGRAEIITHEGKDYNVCMKCAPKVKSDPASYLK
ncbi:MAG: hypothetical protein ACFE68_09685 [Candidatus Hodarchaeota archaeon]